MIKAEEQPLLVRSIHRTKEDALLIFIADSLSLRLPITHFTKFILILCRKPDWSSDICHILLDDKCLFRQYPLEL